MTLALIILAVWFGAGLVMTSLFFIKWLGARDGET